MYWVCLTILILHRTSNIRAVLPPYKLLVRQTPKTSYTTQAVDNVLIVHQNLIVKHYGWKHQMLNPETQGSQAGIGVEAFLLLISLLSAGRCQVGGWWRSLDPMYSNAKGTGKGSPLVQHWQNSHHGSQPFSVWIWCPSNVRQLHMVWFGTTDLVKISWLGQS